MKKTKYGTELPNQGKTDRQQGIRSGHRAQDSELRARGTEHRVYEAKRSPENRESIEETVICAISGS